MFLCLRSSVSIFVEKDTPSLTQTVSKCHICTPRAEPRQNESPTRGMHPLIMHQCPNALKLGMPTQPKTQLSSMLSSLILHDMSLNKKTPKVISFGNDCFRK